MSVHVQCRGNPCRPNYIGQTYQQQRNNNFFFQMLSFQGWLIPDEKPVNFGSLTCVTHVKIFYGV